MRIGEEIRNLVVALDRRYRSSWDVRSIAHVMDIGHQSVANILREARGPRPKKALQTHDRRTRFLFRDVMWSSDFMKLPDGRELIKTMDEMSRFRLGWDAEKTETAALAVRHGEAIIERMGRGPLVWKFDHGSPFTSALFQDFLARHNILPYPIPPRSPWVNGRNERDNQEVQNWLIPLDFKKLTTQEIDRDIDDGMLMLNYIKPRAVLGYRKSADVYFNTDGVEELDREWLKLDLKDIKCRLGWTGWRENEKINRRAIRQLLQKWSLYEEWEEIPKGAKIVNTSEALDVSF